MTNLLNNDKQFPTKAMIRVLELQLKSGDFLCC